MREDGEPRMGPDRAASDPVQDFAAGLDCPVCPARDLRPDGMACPSCGSDLAPLWRLRELPVRLYNEALALAASGEDDAAIAGLEASVRAGGEPGRARVVAGKLHWRAGRPDAARTAWRSVAAEDPWREKAETLLAAADETGGAVSSGGRLRRAAVPLGIAVLAVPATLLLLQRPPAPAPFGAPPAGRAAPAPARTPEGAAPTEPGEAPLVLPGLDTIRGLASVVVPGGLRLTFGDGLFGAGSHEPSADGLTALGRVARVLGDAGLPLHVEVAGYTDDVPPRPGGPWPDNWTLALARAHESALALRGGATDAPITWSARPGEPGTAPWPNGDAEGRARNRTVVLTVRR